MQTLIINAAPGQKKFLESQLKENGMRLTFLDDLDICGTTLGNMISDNGYQAVYFANYFDDNKPLVREMVMALAGAQNPPSIIVGGIEDGSKRAEVLNISHLNGYGVDDAINSKMSDGELAAAIKSCVRRRHGHAFNIIANSHFAIDITAQKVIAISDDLRKLAKEQPEKLVIDPDAFEDAGTVIDLPPRVYKIIEYLFLNMDNTVPHEKLEDYLHTHRLNPPEANVISPALTDLRAKLSKASGIPKAKIFKTDWENGLSLPSTYDYK